MLERAEEEVREPLSLIGSEFRLFDEFVRAADEGARRDGTADSDEPSEEANESDGSDESAGAEVSEEASDE